MAIKNFFSNISSIFDGNASTTPTTKTGQGVANVVDNINEFFKRGEVKRQKAIQGIATSEPIQKGIDGLETIMDDTQIDEKITNVIVDKNPIIGLANDSEKIKEETKEQLQNGLPMTTGEPTSTVSKSKEAELSGNVMIDTETSANEQAQSDLEKVWEREDKIRAETQAREDNAYQRAISDMRKAGINPELVGISPASSGGGITQASRKENVLSSQISAITNELTNALSNEVKQDEGSKDRVQNIISSVLMALMFKKAK